MNIQFPKQFSGGSVELVGDAAVPVTSALILLHGRGSCAAEMLSLGQVVAPTSCLLVAPEARLGGSAGRRSWYPQSFLNPRAENEPYLGDSLEGLAQLTLGLQRGGLVPSLLGFSQGACLASQFLVEHPEKVRSAVIFTGGAIELERQLVRESEAQSMRGCRILMSTSDPDPHVPLSRVRETVTFFENRGADVSLQVYSNAGHTITEDARAQARELLMSVK